MRNQAVRWEERDGEIRIIAPRSNSLKVRLLSLLFFLPRERVVELDALGSELVRMCDGTRTVAQLSDHLARTRKLNPREAEVALLKYLEMLVKRGILGLAVPAPRDKRRK